MATIKKSISCILIFVVACLCFLSAVGCSDSDENNVSNPTEALDEGGDDYKPLVTSEPIVYPFTFVDHMGNSVVLEQEPLTVVTVGPEITEIMFSIGRGIQIVGRSDEDNYPYDVKDITSIGSINEPDAEKIKELNPDLVLVADKVAADKIDKIKETNIPTVIMKTPQLFSDVYENIRYLGRVLNAEQAAYSFIMDLEGQVSNVLMNNAGNETYKLCIVVDYDEENDVAITSKSDNSKYGYYDDVAQLTRSQVVDIDESPHFIICIGEETKVQVEKNTDLQDVPAVKFKKVNFIPEETFDNRGPRAITSFYAIAEIIGFSLS